MAVNETLTTVDSWQRENLERCGLSFLEVEDAIQLGVDFRDLAAFLADNPECSPSMAYRIVQPLDS